MFVVWVCVYGNDKKVRLKSVCVRVSFCIIIAKETTI